MDEIKSLLGRMKPKEVAEEIAGAARDLFPLLDEEERKEFIERMLGGPGEDKVVGMVHL